MNDSDYSTWLTKQQAAEAIGVTTKTIERFVQAGQIQQARRRRDGQTGPEVAVYQPDDVARIAQARQRGPLPAFLVPPSTRPANGNGHAGSTALAIASPPPLTSPNEVASILCSFVAALRRVSETSETPTLFVTIAEAAAVTGLSQAYLRRAIEAGTLKAEKDRGWRIRRRDLEAL